MSIPYEQRITDSETGAEKGQKLARYDLVPVRALRALAEHFGKSCVEHGGKYEGRNWEKGVAWSLNYAAAMRHLTQWWEGEELDEDGNSHLAAVLWHASALIEYAVTHPEKDDRPVSSPDWTEAANPQGQIDANGWDVDSRTWTETLENGQEITFVYDRNLPKDMVWGGLVRPDRVGDFPKGYVHTDSPTSYQDLLADEAHRAWNERQKQRCADMADAWIEEHK